MSTPRQALQLPDHVRVRLRYSTPNPTTEAALVMSKQLGVPGPYGEEVWILVPAGNAYSLLEAFLEPFAKLKDLGIVPENAELTSYKIEAGPEPHTLAYVLNE